jgi:hypothetical protein
MADKEDVLVVSISGGEDEGLATIFYFQALA